MKLKNSIKKKIRKFLIPDNKLLVFNLHQSTPDFDPQRHGKYTWSSIGFFESQIRYLKNNFELVRLDKAINKLRGGKLKGTQVSITFDDGDISVQEYIIPLLEKYRIPATFFINTSYLSSDSKGYWFNIYNYFKFGNEKQQRYLTDDIKEIAKKLRNIDNPVFYRENYRKIESLGKYFEKNTNFYVTTNFLVNLDSNLFSIGLHGHEHQRFSMMTKEWQKNDLKRNIEILSKFKSYIPIFAIPFGKPNDWNSNTLEVCKELRLEVAFANGGYNIKNNFGLLRIPADGINISQKIADLSPFIKKYYI